MRKPKDFDAELKALDERARQLRTRKVQQLGELVIATGADALPADVLAGTLLSAVATEDTAIREGWNARGAAFFQQTKRKQRSTGASASGTWPSSGETLPLTGSTGPR